MRDDGDILMSASTWQQPMPQPAGPVRAAVIDAVARKVIGIGNGRLRVAIDGRTAAGKTTFGHELARSIAASGRAVLRASLDDFKRPWSEAHLYDRASGEGYYRNAFDLHAIRGLLLAPAAPGAAGDVVLCLRDPITQIDHSEAVVAMARNAVLVVDGVFAFRPELDDCWDVRVWLQIDGATSLRRGIARDTERVGGDAEAEALHRDRYAAAEAIYISEVDPADRADVVIDNTEIAEPRLLT